MTIKSTNPSNEPLPPPILPPNYGAVVAAAETVVIDNETTPLTPDEEQQQQASSSSNNAAVILLNDGIDTSSPQWRDVWFAICFWIHAAIMIWLGIWVAPAGYANFDIDLGSIETKLREDNDVTDEELAQLEEFASQVSSYVQVYPLRILLYLVLPCLILAFIVAFLAMVLVVKPFSKAIVYASLIGSLAFMSFVMIASTLASGSAMAFVGTGVMLGFVMYYVTRAWRLVPFAAVNLKVSMEGMNSNCGIYFVGFLFSQLGFLWWIFWTYTLFGVSSKKNTDCQAEHPGANFDMTSDTYDDVCDPPFIVWLLFLLSLLWTSTVLMNTIQVTVAGVMATWCFDKKEADNCCSSAVYASLYRSLTYSFGSICFGSLMQALISLLRYLVENARNNRDRRDDNGCGTIMLCILECIVKLLEDIIDYFNQWAYVIVGIYGFSYLESGKHVIELFRARGWTSIITDNLVGYTLSFVTLIVGTIMGFVGIFLENLVSANLHDNVHTDFESYLGLNNISSFVLGFTIGIWVCSVMMNVIKGAVNTLIVCWADSPAVMEAEHPDRTKEMAEAWTSVFPDLAVQIRPAYAAVVV